MCLSISRAGSRRMLKGIQEAARLLILTSGFQKEGRNIRMNDRVECKKREQLNKRRGKSR